MPLPLTDRQVKCGVDPGENECQVELTEFSRLLVMFTDVKDIWLGKKMKNF